jgi:hypothetical protein
MGKLVDLTGKRFGKWLVQYRSPQNLHGKPAWVCVCDCGGKGVVSGSVLRMGESTSCGCYQKSLAAKNLGEAASKHRAHNTPEYFRWLNMKARCNNPNNPAYANYGGRGISVCARWDKSFDAFMSDVGERPTPEHSLDRIDNDGNYEPNNVRWATSQEQANNRRNNMKVEFNGETKTIAEWARVAGITPEGVAYRHKKGKDLV